MYVLYFYRFGPLVRHWTMRYEAKHSYFKRLTQSMNNFINLPYSLASRHQQYQCYLNTNTKELPGCVDDIDVGPGDVCTFICCDVYINNVLKCCLARFKLISSN